MNIRDWITPLLAAATVHGAVSLFPVDLRTGKTSAPETMQIAFRLQQPPVAKPEQVVEEPDPQPQKTPDAVQPEPEPQEQAAARVEVASLPRAKAQPQEVPDATAPRLDLRDYGRMVYQSVNRVKRYPVVAKRLKLSGRVLVELSVDRKGNLVGRPNLYQSSGHQLLDDEALRMVQEAGPYPPLPGGFSKSSATIVIPIDFSWSV